MSDFGTLAEETGLSQEELAARLKISITTLWRYRNGHAKRMDSNVVDRMRGLHAEITTQKVS